MRKERNKSLLQKERIDLRCHTKICPTCSEEFDGSEHTVCPVDQSLLCPVGIDSLIGVQISHFEIVSKIGSGSSSNVYSAKAKEARVSDNGVNDGSISPDSLTSIEQKVAVKVLDANLLSDPTAIKRFQLEAQLVRSLNHPQIAAVLDFGVLPDGRPYLILEYVEGETLKEHLDKKGKLDSSNAIAIFGDIIDAVEAAHRAGILHRDIKPSNVILDANGRAKVVDFGIAKVIGIEDTATVTLTGVSVGTPAYMSPEQCLGQEQDVRSDIYSLGCLLYECLSGSKVFPADNAFNCMRQHSFFEPVALSKLVPAVKAPIATAVMKCLEKDADDRFQSIEHLRAALLGDASIVPTPRGQSKRAGSVRASGNPITKMALNPILLVAVSVAIAFGFRLMKIQEQTRLPPTSYNHNALTPHDLAEIDSILNKASYDGVWTKLLDRVPMEPTEIAVGKLTPFGTINEEHVISDVPIFAGVRDAAGMDWYVLALDGLIKFDPKNKTVASIPVPNGLPDTKFCSGITRDTKRNRILVLTEEFVENSNLVDNTTLLAYDPTTNEWSLLAKIKDLTLQGLAYSPSDDTFYTLAFKSVEEGGLHSGSLCQLTANGAIKAIVPLAEDPSNRLATQPPSIQLAVYDRFLIATLEGRKTVVLDRNTGQILRTMPK